MARRHGAGGYTRYDGINADSMKSIVETLLEEYYGDIGSVHEGSTPSGDLEQKLQSFKGVGSVTTKIFLRALREICQKADPDLTTIEKEAAKNPGIVSNQNRITERVKQYWGDNCIPGFDFRNLKAALVHHGLHLGRSESSDSS